MSKNKDIAKTDVYLYKSANFDPRAKHTLNFHRGRPKAPPPGHKHHTWVESPLSVAVNFLWSSHLRLRCVWGAVSETIKQQFFFFFQRIIKKSKSKMVLLWVPKMNQDIHVQNVIVYFTLNPPWKDIWIGVLNFSFKILSLDGNHPNVS